MAGVPPPPVCEAIIAAAAVVPLAASVSFSGRRRPERGGAQVEQLEHHPQVEPGLELAQEQPHPGRRDQGTAEHGLEERAPFEADQRAPGPRQRDVEPADVHGGAV